MIKFPGFQNYKIRGNNDVKVMAEYFDVVLVNAVINRGLVRHSNSLSFTFRRSTSRF